MNIIKGSAQVLGEEVSTDIHCSSKYLPGKDTAYIAQCAFEQVSPGFAKNFKKGDVIVAGKNFGCRWFFPGTGGWAVSCPGPITSNKRWPAGRGCGTWSSTPGSWPIGTAGC